MSMRHFYRVAHNYNNSSVNNMRRHYYLCACTFTSTGPLIVVTREETRFHARRRGLSSFKPALSIFCLFEIQCSKSSLAKPPHQDLLSSESQHQPERQRERESGERERERGGVRRESEKDGSTFTLTPKKNLTGLKITLNIQSSKCIFC